MQLQPLEPRGLVISATPDWELTQAPAPAARHQRHCTGIRQQRRPAAAADDDDAARAKADDGDDPIWEALAAAAAAGPAAGDSAAAAQAAAAGGFGSFARASQGVSRVQAEARAVEDQQKWDGVRPHLHRGYVALSPEMQRLQQEQLARARRVLVRSLMAQPPCCSGCGCSDMLSVEPVAFLYIGT